MAHMLIVLLLFPLFKSMWKFTIKSLWSVWNCTCSLLCIVLCFAKFNQWCGLRYGLALCYQPSDWLEQLVAIPDIWRSDCTYFGYQLKLFSCLCQGLCFEIGVENDASRKGLSLVLCVTDIDHFPINWCYFWGSGSSGE